MTHTRRTTLKVVLPILAGGVSGCISSLRSRDNSELIIMNDRDHRIVVHVRAVDEERDEVGFSDTISLEPGGEKEYVDPIEKEGGYNLNIDIEGEDYTWTDPRAFPEADDTRGVIVAIESDDVRFEHFIR